MGDSHFDKRLQEILSDGNRPQFKRGYFAHGSKAKHPDYNVWRKMRSRCNDPRNKDFDYYGGKGIRVCERWDDFGAFLLDMGPRPTPEHTIDRIDNQRGYEPGNCRWVTRSEQNRNKWPGGFAGKRPA